MLVPRPHVSSFPSLPRVTSLATLRTAKRPLARLLLVGLTGGIASGKSTVAGMFAARGAAVIDADQLGHEVVVPGEPGLSEVIEAFGADYLEPDGRLNRRLLGARVFASKADRERLNRIVHPRIMLRLKKKLLDLETNADLMRVVIVEAAVLLEAGWAPYFDRIVVVEAQPSLQVSRLTARLGLDAPQATQRVQAQWSIRQRRRYAHFRISGDGPLARTRAEVDAVWTSLQSLLQERVCPISSG